MDTDSEAALVFHYTVLYLLEMTFGDKIGPAYDGLLGISSSPLAGANGFMSRAELRLLQILSENETSAWYMDAKTGRQRTRDQLIFEALSPSSDAHSQDRGRQRAQVGLGPQPPDSLCSPTGQRPIPARLFQPWSVSHRRRRHNADANPPCAHTAARARSDHAQLPTDL